MHMTQVVALVNNAAVMPLGWTAKELQLALRTNVQGPVQLAQQLAPHMRPGRCWSDACSLLSL